MIVHLCVCLSSPLFSDETSLFIYAGGSLHSADEGSENEQWTLWTWEELSVALLSQRLLTLIQDGVWGSRLLGVGGKSWLLSPAVLSSLGLINQLDLFSHSFRHLWYHPGLPLQSVRGMGTYSTVTYACFQRSCSPQTLLTLFPEYPLILMGFLWDQCGLEYLSAGSYM